MFVCFGSFSSVFFPFRKSILPLIMFVNHNCMITLCNAPQPLDTCIILVRLLRLCVCQSVCPLRDSENGTSCGHTFLTGVNNFPWRRTLMHDEFRTRKQSGARSVCLSQRFERIYDVQNHTFHFQYSLYLV